MTWLTRHRARRDLRSSLFVPPTASIVLALAVAPVIRWIDDRIDRAIAGASDLQGFGSRSRVR